jgi:V/A-type H+-transporting ATPase subunit D
MTRDAALAPTRHGLLQARRHLLRVDKGGELLARKRQALVAEFFRLARAAIEARDDTLDLTALAYETLLQALPLHGASTLEALGWPTRDVEASVEEVNVWGILSAEIAPLGPVKRSPSERGTSLGATGPAAIATADAFETLIEQLLSTASREIQVRRIGDELARASRQLNTLERRVRPALAAQIWRTQQTLDEREREDHTRLRRFRQQTPT